MTDYSAIIISIVCSSLLVILLLIMVARRPKVIDKIFAPLLAIIVAGGLLIYGYGFALHEQYLYSAIVRTALQVIGMFAGKDSYGVVADTPLFSTLPGQVVFWTIHLLALYMTAGTILLTIGSAVVQTHRRLILRFSHKQLDVIYGTDENAQKHAEAVLDYYPKTMIVFVQDRLINDYSNFVKETAFVALDLTNSHFEKHLGLKRKKEIHLYCLDSSEQKNLKFATKFSELLGNAGKSAYLTIRSPETSVEENLNNPMSHYTSIFAYSEPDIMARMVTKAASFVDYVSFDDKGIAQNDLNIAVIGFGLLGQAIFDSVIRNTQFHGCQSNYYVIDKKLDDQWGPYKLRHASLFDEYNITWIGKDARSLELIEMLGDRYKKLDVVLLCTGDDEHNDSLAYVWRQLVKDDCKIIECTATSFKIYQTYSEPINLYGSDALITKTIDDQAMKINQVYNNMADLEKSWKEANEFSRQSCRAMADFIPSYQKITAKHKTISDELLENLSIIEHLRWCAFHYTNGYKTMDEKTIRERFEMRNQEIKQTGSSNIRITVDRDAKLHACLIPWEELDKLSILVEELTGEKIDYKELDRQNVRNIEHFIS